MSVVIKLLVGGWIVEGALVALCALNQSGGLIKIHKRVGEWLRAVAPPNIGVPEK